MIRARVHIAASPEEVFAVLADGARYADWVVGVKAIRRADDEFPRPGSRLHHTVGVLALVARDTTRVVREDRPRLLVLDAHAKALRATVRFELHPDQRGTMVVMEEEGADELSRQLARAARPFILARNAETLWRLHAQVANRSDRRRPTPTSADHDVPVPRWLGDTTARVFGLATALRGARVFHPRGVTRGGTAQLLGRGKSLVLDERADALVRFSRAVGLPARLPDVNGIAVRFVDAVGPGRHRDLLFASVGSGPLRHVLVPAVDFGAARFSSLLGFRLDGKRVVLTAEVSGRGLTLDRLRSPDPVELMIHAVANGDAEQIATVMVAEVVDGTGVRFEPGATDDALVPVGFLNGLRDPAYAASQAVRGGHDGHVTAQDGAASGQLSVRS